MNFERARFNMIEQQVRPWDVLDQRVLDVMSVVPREDFVPTPFRKLAYADHSIPMNERESMLVPREIGRILQAVAIEPTDKVLEIGTGTGYLTALLAHLTKQVITVEIDEQLLNTATKNLEQLKLTQVTFEEGDGAKGWSRSAPYNVIIITGAMSEVPDSYKKNLCIGGRLFVITGSAPAMKAQLITKVNTEQWRTTTLFETVVPYLKNAHLPKAFQL